MSPVRETDVDWAEARVFLLSRISERLDRVEPTVLQDITQDALVRTLRAVRQHGAENLKALMHEIARCTCVDYIRKRRCWALLVEPMSDSMLALPDRSTAAPDQLGDPSARLRFTVLEFFGLRSKSCHDLALRFFAEQDWQSVALQLGRTYAAVRQQWSRCIALLKQEARGSSGFLCDWVPEDE